MEKLVRRLRDEYPQIAFVAGEVASWSFRSKTITYSPDGHSSSVWAVLHELGHAILDHADYHSDMQLLQKEAAAWEQACMLGEHYGVSINEDHIQECLDTYRDWLYKRSTCPTCSAHGLQQSEGRYNCLNCKDTWRVSVARFCRPYRLKS